MTFARPRTLAGLLGILLVLLCGKATAGGVQAMVNALEAYAADGDTAPLRLRLHSGVRECVPNVEANTIARFVLTRVSRQGVAEELETRRVSPEQTATLRREARQMGLAMPVTPEQELRLVYDDHTARLFLATDGGELRWVLPCQSRPPAG